MKRVLTLTAFLFLVMLLASCSKTLTNDQAMEAIRKEGGYPKLVTTKLLSIKPDSKIGQEISRLISEGYMLVPEKRGPYGYVLKVTEKGKNFVKWCSYYKGYTGEFITHKADIARIKQILTDSKEGTATVVYEVGYTLTPFGERLINLGAKIKKEEYEGQAYFKKYDQGWVLSGY